MSTIPVYLYAYYSIKPEGQGEKARKMIKSVFREEMLHLALAGNTLYALGKAPILYSPTHIPNFPGEILFTPITMHLQDGRKENIKTFVDIEAPSKFPNPRCHPNDPAQYNSIGHFYEAIKSQLEVHHSSIRKGKHQISKNDGIWRGDDLIVVSNLDLANEALNIIIEQGEGTHGDGGHYKQFLDLWQGPIDWDHHPVVENPKTEWYKGKTFYEVLLTFDAAYCYLVLSIERLYRVLGDKRVACSGNIRIIMGRILTPLAIFLQGERVDEWSDDETVAGPCFNYYQLDSKDPLQSLKNEIAAAVGNYKGDRKRKLEDIRDDINKLNKLPVAEVPEDET